MKRSLLPLFTAALFLFAATPVLAQYSPAKAPNQDGSTEVTPEDESTVEESEEEAIKVPSVDIGLQSSIVYQTLEQRNDDNSLDKIAPGFQNAVGNITLRAEVFEGGQVGVDIFLSSKHHEEMYGYQGFFLMTQLPSWMKLGTINDFYANHLEVKAGQFTLGYGDGHLYQSVNGDVVNNELVGNAVVRPALTTLGAEATLKAGPARFMAGFSNGTTSGTTTEGKGIAVHGKVTLLPIGDMLRVSLSGYRVDQSGNGNGYNAALGRSEGTKSYLYQGGDRAGARYDVWGSDDGGEMFLGKGEDETALQLDTRLDLGRVLLYGAAGYNKDADSNGLSHGADGVIDTADDADNGNPIDIWRYYMGTARVNLTDWLYLAGRYSVADATKLQYFDATTQSIADRAAGIAKRTQIGVGFRLYDGIVMKAEYVKQTTSGFSTGFRNGGTDLGLNPEFSGFAIETAVRF
jgi:hypothetical protein